MGPTFSNRTIHPKYDTNPPPRGDKPASYDTRELRYTGFPIIPRRVSGDLPPVVRLIKVGLAAYTSQKKRRNEGYLFFGNGLYYTLHGPRAVAQVESTSQGKCQSANQKRRPTHPGDSSCGPVPQMNISKKRL